MIPLALQSWVIRHGITPEAMTELAALVGCAPTVPTVAASPTEAYAQSQVRLAAGRAGVTLARNNVGVLRDKHDRPVRFGLFNDTSALNATVKSSDLIGWRPVLVTEHMAGTTVAQFVARECKRPGWSYTGDARETAQRRFIDMVLADGGDAAFTTGEFA